MIPLFIIIVIGTYLLFSQFSVYFTDKFQNNKKVYYKGINLIVLSQIIYKLKDNAKILFITSILSGVTLASAVSVYSLQKMSFDVAEKNCPQDIGIMEQGVNSHKVIAKGKVEEILNKYKFDIKYKNQTKLIRGKINDKIEKSKKNYSMENLNDFNIMSQGEFNELAKQYNRKLIKLEQGEAVIYRYDFQNDILNMKNSNPFKDKKFINLNMDGNISKWKITKNVKGGIINSDEKNSNCLIINDNDFKKLWNSAKDSSKFIYYGYNIKNKLKAVNAIKEMKSNVVSERIQFFNERILNLVELIQTLSLLLFIGTFIAIIFFAATGSILYFKMFNEIQKDKQDFIGLKKIGVTQEEIKKVVSIQSCIMFFLPLIVAVIHAIFAVKSIGLLYGIYFMFVLGIYLILQIIYYLFAKWMYIKQINSWGI